jgi:alpha-mannosidase
MEHSFVQPKADNVIVTAVKKSEDENALILRFYEWAGKQGDVDIQLPPGATSASETDLMERPLGDLPVSKGEVKVPTKPYEIKTIKVRFSGLTEMAGDRQ